LESLLRGDARAAILQRRGIDFSWGMLAKEEAGGSYRERSKAKPWKGKKSEAESKIKFSTTKLL
jgi:hypothetical protein